MTNQKFDDLFGAPVRDPNKYLLTSFHMDIAASIQNVTEEVMLRLARALAQEHDLANLCLAGGVALNCVANGKILRDAPSRISGSSLPPVTLAARWGPLSRFGISSWGMNASSTEAAI